MANCTAYKVLNKSSECDVATRAFSVDLGRITIFADSCRCIIDLGEVSQTSCVLVVIPTFDINVALAKH